MGAFKQFLSTDVTVVPFVVNKSFTFNKNTLSSSAEAKTFVGWDIPEDYANNRAFYIPLQGYTAGGIYNSIKQLYYTNYIPTPNQSKSPTPVYDYNGNLLEDYTTTATNARFYNYEQTTLFQTNSINYTSSYGYSRYYRSGMNYVNGRVYVLSIPRDSFGDYINPNTFYLKFDDQGQGLTVTDNGEGILVTGSNTPIGIITYQHGIISLNYSFPTVDNNWIYYNNMDSITCSFQSSRTIYETQYKCTIRPDEFNYSLNPSLISGSTDGTPYDFVTGSYFSPYVTTIGLYNENQELLAVAKLGQPLPTSRTTDTTIVINLDR